MHGQGSHPDVGIGEATVVRYARRMASARAPRGPVISGHVLDFVIDQLKGFGIDGRACMRGRGLVLPDPAPRRVPVSQLHGLWESVCAEHGESSLGVRMAERTGPEHYALFGRLVASASNLGEALLMGTRLMQAIASSLEVSFTMSGKRGSVLLDPVAPDHLHPEAAEFLTAVVLILARSLTGKHLVTEEVFFMHAPRGDQAYLERFFGAPVRYRAAHCGYHFDTSILQLPVVGDDPELRAALQQKAERVLSRTGPRGDLLGALRGSIAAELCGGNPSIAVVSTALGLHPKALSRRLTALGTSFRAEVERLRYAEAERHLRDPDLSVEQVALLLGYSEASTFNRAFKRWAGCTPAEYRGRHRSSC